MDERGPEQRGGDTEVKRARSLGRRIATGVFWLLTLYMAAVGFYSIIPQVFAPQAADWAERALPDGCQAGIQDLKSELLARASARVAAGGHAAGEPALHRWLRSWDERYVALHGRCRGGSSGAYEDLGRLRDRTGATLQRFERDHAPLARRIDRALGSPEDPTDSDESSR